jgi:protein-tyrosine phosphatase
MSTSTVNSPSRRIEMDGPVNFRDLGGYVTHDGRSVQWRRVFRADALDTITPSDVDRIVDGLGIRTIIDLRNEQEIGMAGLGVIPELPLRWVNVSILDETQPMWRTAMAEGTMVEQYMAMMIGSPEKFVEAVTLVAEADGPVVFHCAAGKDRTGLIAAFVLSMVGVPNDVIAHDYGLTREVIPVLSARFEARAEEEPYRSVLSQKPGWREAARRAMVAEPETIDEVLGRLTETYGSPKGWLEAHGLDPATEDRLRERFLG